LDAAESAIHQSRSRLETSFLHLAQLQKSVVDSLNADDTVVKNDPKKIASERTKPAIDAPHKPVKKVVKKATAKQK
jgi:hypothetical protein